MGLSEGRGHFSFDEYCDPEYVRFGTLRVFDDDALFPDREADRKLMVLKELSLTFVAGVLGGLANSLALWLCGALGLTKLLGVAIAPAFSAPWLYPRLVWGGLWGWLFLLPTPRLTYPTRGLFLSLGPTLVQLLMIFPDQGKGLGGLQLGYLTPLFVVAFNAIWGLVAAVWLKYARSS